MAYLHNASPEPCEAADSEKSDKEEEETAQNVDTEACTTSLVDISPFAASDGLSDLTLVVEGKNLYVHKMILASTSPVFRAMFYPQPGTSFKEKDATKVVLEDKKYDDVVNFLTQVYVQYSRAPITDDSLVGVVRLADEYQVEHAMTKCREYVEEQLKDVSKLYTAQLVMYLWLCKRYRNSLCTRDCGGGTSTSATEPKPLEASSGILGSTEIPDQQKPDSHDLTMEEVIRKPIHDVQKCQYYSRLTEDEQNHIILRRCQTLEKEHTLIIQFVKKIEAAFSGSSKACHCSSYQVRTAGTAVGQGFFCSGFGGIVTKIYETEDPRRPVCASCICNVAKALFSPK